MVHYDIFYISYNTPLSDFLFGARRAGASMYHAHNLHDYILYYHHVYFHVHVLDIHIHILDHKVVE